MKFEDVRVGDTVVLKGQSVIMTVTRLLEDRIKGDQVQVTWFDTNMDVQVYAFVAAVLEPVIVHAHVHVAEIDDSVQQWPVGMIVKGGTS